MSATSSRGQLITTGAHTAASADELRTTLTDLATSSSQYQTLYAPRPLTRDDTEEAGRLAAHLRSRAMNVRDLWADELQTLPTPAELLDILQILKAGVGTRTVTGVRARMRNARTSLGLSHSDHDIRELFDLVDRLFSVANLGHYLLQTLRPLVAHSKHYEMHCYRLYGDADDYHRRRSTELRSDLEQVVDTIQDDVDSQRSQIEMLGLYTQTTLSNAQTVLSYRLQGLTVVLTLVTVFLLVATLIALAR